MSLANLISVFSFLSFLEIPWDDNTLMTLPNCRDKVHTFLQHFKMATNNQMDFEDIHPQEFYTGLQEDTICLHCLWRKSQGWCQSVLFSSLTESPSQLQACPATDTLFLYHWSPIRKACPGSKPTASPQARHQLPLKPLWNVFLKMGKVQQFWHSRELNL